MAKFKRPDGLMVPEGLADGQAFDAIGTFVIKGDNLVLVKVDGETVPGYADMVDKLDRGEPMDEEPEEPMEKQLHRTMSERRGY